MKKKQILTLMEQFEIRPDKNVEKLLQFLGGNGSSEVKSMTTAPIN